MNERIKLLAEQAAWKTRMTHNNAHWRMQEKLEDITWREKFAMSIVEECMKLNHEHFNDEDPYSIDSLYMHHFGVE